MDDEERWNPPWDCDSDADDDYEAESMKVNLSSPFKNNTSSDPFRIPSSKEQNGIGSAKKELHFDEVDTEMEEIHRDSTAEASQDLYSATQESSQINKVSFRKKNLFETYIIYITDTVPREMI